MVDDLDLAGGYVRPAHQRVRYGMGWGDDVVAERTRAEPLGPQQPPAVEGQLVRVMGGHHGDRCAGEATGRQPNQRSVEQMRLEHLRASTTR